MAAGRRVLVSGMGGDLGRASPRCSRTNRGSASSSGSTSTRRGDGCDRAEFHLVAPDRPRPRRRDDHVVQPARRRAHLGLGAAQPGEPVDGPPADRRCGDLDPRRRRRVPGAGVGDRAQRHGDLRPGPWRADPARRVRRRRPDERLRAHARRHRAHRRGDRPARRRHRRGDPHGHGARSARAQPARAGAADAGGALQRARRPAVRRRRGRRGGQGVRRRRRAAPRRAGERRRQRGDHRPAGGPPRPPHPRSRSSVRTGTSPR